MEKSIKVVASNRRAHHDYDVLERMEAGLALQGSEIKSIRAGQVNLRDGYVRVEAGQAWLHNTHIAVYDPASRMNHDPLRNRRLLLHRREIAELAVAQQQKGLTVIPLRLYLRNGRAKVEIALARGRKSYDKRQAIARRDAEREMARAVRRKR
jgi:SsrA-binding protein